MTAVSSKCMGAVHVAAAARAALLFSLLGAALCSQCAVMKAAQQLLRRPEHARARLSSSLALPRTSLAAATRASWLAVCPLAPLIRLPPRALRGHAAHHQPWPPDRRQCTAPSAPVSSAQDKSQRSDGSREGCMSVPHRAEPSRDCRTRWEDQLQREGAARLPPQPNTKTAAADVPQ